MIPNLPLVSLLMRGSKMVFSSSGAESIRHAAVARTVSAITAVDSENNISVMFFNLRFMPVRADAARGEEPWMVI